jgi:ketopantoate hydroxymethyltransferase
VHGVDVVHMQATEGMSDALYNAIQWAHANAGEMPYMANSVESWQAVNELVQEHAHVVVVGHVARYVEHCHNVM